MSGCLVAGLVPQDAAPFGWLRAMSREAEVGYTTEGIGGNLMHRTSRNATCESYLHAEPHLRSVSVHPVGFDSYRLQRSWPSVSVQIKLSAER